MQSLFTVFVLLILATLPFKVSSQKNWFNHLKINQKGTVNYIFDASDSVELNKSTFAIRFYNKPYDGFNDHYYAAKIAVLEEKPDTSLFKHGQTINNIPYFEVGTGMSPSHHGTYDAMVVSSTGHHYLFYENKKSKRVHLIIKHDDYYELEWEINFFNANGIDLPLSEITYSRLYIVVFIDYNLNDVIDAYELKTVLLKFS
ncbi:MAG: hypothetical protein IT221_13100 [Fluviicola sp.]|nr:hypothetical protein [Fluviicola sp.]